MPTITVMDTHLSKWVSSNPNITLLYSLKSSNQPKHKGMPSESRDVSYYKAKDAFTIDMKDQISKWYTPISNKSREESKSMRATQDSILINIYKFYFY